VTFSLKYPAQGGRFTELIYKLGQTRRSIIGGVRQPAQILKLDTAKDEATAFHKELYWIHYFAGQTHFRGGGILLLWHLPDIKTMG
jgi:hypothetical protein